MGNLVHTKCTLDCSKLQMMDENKTHLECIIYKMNINYGVHIKLLKKGKVFCFCTRTDLIWQKHCRLIYDTLTLFDPPNGSKKDMYQHICRMALLGSKSEILMVQWHRREEKKTGFYYGEIA